MSSMFRLQRVLELKEWKEQVTAVRLAEAHAFADEARRHESELETLREGGTLHLTSNGSVTAGNLQNAAYLMGHLDQRLDDARSAIRRAESTVDTCMAEFLVATRDRRALDRLKDRQDQAAMVEAVTADRNVMNEVALSRFTRGDHAGEHPGGEG